MLQAEATGTHAASGRLEFFRALRRAKLSSLGSRAVYVRERDPLCVPPELSKEEEAASSLQMLTLSEPHTELHTSISHTSSQA